jgi:hypothetical protein
VDESAENNGPGAPVGAGAARTLPAAGVAELLGRGKRCVLLWCKETPPCPHTVIQDRGRAVPRFELGEVKDWLRARGYAVWAPGATDPAAAAGGMLSFATPAGEAPEPPKTPALPPPVAGTGLAARIAQAEQMLLDHQSRVVAETAGSLVFQQRAAEFKVISTELRMLKQEQRDEELRAGQWVRRGSAASMFAGLGELFASDLAALEADAARTVIAAIEAEAPGALASERIDQVKRIFAVAMRSLTDAVRARTVETARRRIAELESKAKEQGAESAAGGQGVAA